MNYTEKCLTCAYKNKLDGCHKCDYVLKEDLHIANKNTDKQIIFNFLKKARGNCFKRLNDEEIGCDFDCPFKSQKSRRCFIFDYDDEDLTDEELNELIDLNLKGD